MQTPTESLTVYYPEAVELTTKQLHVFWLPDEVNVEKDLQDMLVNMTEAEKHGVITTLKLFTLYEAIAGDEYWGGRFKKEFPRPDLLRMASAFSMFELAIHLPFYNKINELLHLNTDEFYTEYTKDPTLSARMDFIDNIVNHKDPLISLGAFSMVEGAVLYSSFAFLKHFQSQGKNKLMNIVRGINFSVRDENLHCLGGAWAFRQLKDELKMTEDQIVVVESTLRQAARALYEHEARIADMIFEKGSISGITATQLKNFVQSRLNECFTNLGFEKEFDVKYNPIADWFYDGINGFAFNDFFSGVGNSYQRNWSEAEFVWETNNG